MCQASSLFTHGRIPLIAHLCTSSFSVADVTACHHFCLYFAGQAEGARAEQKVGNLQRLCRALQAENKVLEETSKKSRGDFLATAEVSRTPT
jgi:hypothetical protein